MSRFNDQLLRPFLGAALFFFILVEEAQTQTITFVSDTTWAVSDPGGSFLGFAQNVCLYQSAPTNCPAGATLYFLFFNGWIADLSNVPGATWIWAPGIIWSTSPSFPAEYFFSKAFDLPGVPTGGTISVTADDFAEVFVNDTPVGTVGSISDPFLSAANSPLLTTFDITTFLVSGTNVVSVRAANGAFGCGAIEYRCNPAGVVFGGSLEFQLSPDVLVENLIEDVVDLNLTVGIENSLDGKLDAVLNALNDLNDNNNQAAVGALQAFILQVEAQSGNQIPESDAVSLIAAAQQIIDLLTGA